MHNNYYLAVGTRENWKRAFANGNVRGLPGDRKPSWRKLKQGDVVFFYVQSPISRVVGYGSVVAKFIADERPIFFEDRSGVTEWPLRFNFEILWPTDPFNGPWVSVKGIVEGRTLKKFHKLRFSKGEELLCRCQDALR